MISSAHGCHRSGKLRYETRVRCSCEGHKKKYQDSDCEKWIGDNDFVYHDVKVDTTVPSHQGVSISPEMNLREGIEQTRKYVGPNRVQCTEMPCMMDLAPVKTWFGVSHPLKMAAKEFMERLPKLGVVTFVCLIFVFVSVFVLGIESVLIKCQAIPSVAGIILLSQCVATFIILICAFVLATWMCIFYSRDDDEYRTVRALFLVVLSVTFLYLPMFTREIAKMTEDCPEEEVTRLGNNTST
ncbi:uncharacterized protein [Ptychodera flava]|uniref:uncharacterized protein isoform X1 n=1 Tax=Ptychodera flava TaxID=63121 RepID=UPI00396A3C2D